MRDNFPLRYVYDVIVVGSGPAGSSAAFALVKNGVNVAIIEKARLPRYKPCGGGLVYRAIKLLPDAVTKAVERECYMAEVNLLDADLHFSATRKLPIISMAMREKFDFLLLSRARDAGADVYTECEAQNLRVHDQKIEIITNKGSLVSGFVIAADRVLSPVAKSAGWKETRYLVSAIECEVFGVDINYDYPKVRTWLFSSYGQRFCEAVTDILVGEKPIMICFYIF